MSKYQVKIYGGTYKSRQVMANEDHAICYIEQHFNADPKGKISDVNYVTVVVASNASLRSKELARTYAKAISAKFNVKYYGNDSGLCIGGFGGRGNGNLVYTKMPAALLEPLFLSNKDMVKLIQQDQNKFVNDLADCLVQTIQKYFPNGGLIAFSVGHKYKPAPYDKDVGCVVEVDLDSKKKISIIEAELAEQVLQKAKLKLESI